jgi:hypothetical protein
MSSDSIRIPANSANLINTNYQAPLAPLGTPTDVGQDASSLTGVEATKKPTVNLFATSSYQTTPKVVTLQDGSTITLPSMSEEEASKMQSLFGNIPADQQDAVNAASSTLAGAVMRHVIAQKNGDSSVSDADLAAAIIIPKVTKAAVNMATPAVGAGSVNTEPVVSNDYGPSTQASAPVAASGSAGYTINQSSPDLPQAVSNAMASYSTASNNGNYDMTVQAVAYMGVQGLQQEMQDYSTVAQNTNNQRSTIRVDQNEINDLVANWPAGSATQSITWHEVDANGNMQTVTRSLSQTDAKKQSDALTNELSALSDTTQLQQVHLQTMSQNYQQAVTTMSNLMRMQYDMVKNTIGNIHY